MHQDMPAMLQQAHIVQTIAASLASDGDGTWSQLRCRIQAVGGIVVASVAAVVDGVDAPRLPPPGLPPLVEQLRSTMQRPGAGTWFALELDVDATGRATTRFDYDHEPAQRVPFTGSDFVRDQGRYPRDLEHQPSWLRQRLAEGVRLPSTAARLVRTDRGLVLQTDNAAEVLQQRAHAAGLREHPALRALFDEHAAGDDDDYIRWYAAWFHTLFPGVRVDDVRVDARAIDQISLSGPPSVLDTIGALPWRIEVGHGREPTGAIAWWSTFLGLIPIPILGWVLWLVTTAVAAFSGRHPRGSAARENGRNGFDWAVSHLLVTAACIAWIVLFTILGREPSAHEGGDARFGPIAGIGILAAPVLLLYAVLAWVHAIRGSIRAGRGEVYRAWGAIPFLRRAAPRDRG